MSCATWPSWNGLGLEDLERSVDESRIRPNDPRSIIGDHDRLTRVTGWVPEHAVEDTVRDYVAERCRAATEPRAQPARGRVTRASRLASTS